MDWFKTWFDTPYYHILYKDRDFQEAEQFLRHLISNIHLEQGAEIIDLACGKGRHSLFLHQLGYRVLGLDLSEESIIHNQNFGEEGLRFGVHDIRDTINNEPVDAVFNLFTSFGYFDESKDDEKVFHSVAQVLKPNGIFVLDYLNAIKVSQTLDTSLKKIVKTGIEFNISKKIIEDSVVKNIKFTSKKKDYEFEEKVKLHTLDSFIKYAQNSGLELEKIWGNYQLSDFDENTSDRCIMLFKKK